MVGSEVCEVYFQDIIACIKSLFKDPEFTPYLVFRPEKHYTDEDKRVCMYHDMHTGQWWWTTQVRVSTTRFNNVSHRIWTQEKLDHDCPGVTIIPIIISSNKTQLTLFKNKTVYPLYLTIGNIPKEICRKPSFQGYILLTYLPTSKLEHVTNWAQRWRLLANLYPACMKRILQPLEAAGVSGISLTSSDGLTCRGHPFFASFVGDYPEQVLTTGTVTGECPACPGHHNHLEDYEENVPPGLQNLDEILKTLSSFDKEPASFLKTSANAGIKLLMELFWKDLPYTNPFRSITPDILHQLYQGIIKHLISWIIEAYGAEEIDARCWHMPPNHNIRLFMKGINSLSHVTGQEHNQMCHILLGLVIDIPLAGGVSSSPLVWSVRALLDFSSLLSILSIQMKLSTCLKMLFRDSTKTSTFLLIWEFERASIFPSCILLDIMLSSSNCSVLWTTLILNIQSAFTLILQKTLTWPPTLRMNFHKWQCGSSKRRRYFAMTSISSGNLTDHQCLSCMSGHPLGLNWRGDFLWQSTQALKLFHLTIWRGDTRLFFSVLPCNVSSLKLTNLTWLLHSWNASYRTSGYHFENFLYGTKSSIFVRIHSPRLHQLPIEFMSDQQQKTSGVTQFLEGLIWQ